MGDDTPKGRLATCERHQLKYDPALHEGCVVCRREAPPAPRQGPSRAQRWEAVFGVCAIAVALALSVFWRTPDEPPPRPPLLPAKRPTLQFGPSNTGPARATPKSADALAALWFNGSASYAAILEVAEPAADRKNTVAQSVVRAIWEATGQDHKLKRHVDLRFDPRSQEQREWRDVIARKAEAGDLFFTLVHAHSLLTGTAGALDPALGEKLLARLVERDFPPAVFLRAKLTLSSPAAITEEVRRGVELMEHAAALGIPGAAYEVGRLNMSGKGVPRNDRKAIAWWTRAAEAGHAGAQLELGLASASGGSVERDDAAARRWLRLAAQQGEEQAVRELMERYGEKPEDPRPAGPALAPAEALEHLRAAKLMLRDGDERGFVSAIRAADSLFSKQEVGHPTSKFRTLKMNTHGEGLDCVRFAAPMLAWDSLVVGFALPRSLAKTTPWHFAPVQRPERMWDTYELNASKQPPWGSNYVAFTHRFFNQRDITSQAAYWFCFSFPTSEPVEVQLAMAAYRDSLPAFQLAYDGIPFKPSGREIEAVALGAGPLRTEAVLESALHEGNTKLVDHLIARGVNLRAAPVLATAAAGMYPFERIPELIARGADPNQRDEYEHSPLSSLVFRHDKSDPSEAEVQAKLDAVRALLNAGARVNERNRFGETALMTAAAGDSAELIKILLDAGASRGLRDDRGMTALDIARADGTPQTVAALAN